MEQKKQRIIELIEELNRASKAYYQESREIMSNLEYDAKYDELQKLEEETGYVLSFSPTMKVGYEVVSELPKEKHIVPMLSLDKTKDREALKEWLKGKEGILSWKLDGLTNVLTYEDGVLVKAVTRGNGEVGEIITNNAKVYKNVPLKIPYKGTLVVRGEAIITYSEFERINAEITEAEAKYKNPRNLCSGTVRQLSNEITAQRNVLFYAYTLISSDIEKEFQTREEQLAWLTKQGFTCVESKKVTGEDIVQVIDAWEKEVANNDFPSDGLVLTFDEIAYAQSLGRTAKFPRDSIAFKWADEQAQTVLKEIEWSASRTGLINPIAIFEPVELEGTTVSRASLHNVSIMEGLQLGIGDTIEVYKANMIIPQVAKNITKSGTAEPPKQCPVCMERTELKEENGVKVLYCTNPQCAAKKSKLFAHFVSRDALNIEGFSEATIEKLLNKKIITVLTDLFTLEQHKEEITQMEGFGEKSFHNLLASIEKARHTTLPRLIYSLGIPNVGLSTAKLICSQFEEEPERVLAAKVEQLTEIEGVGEVIAGTFVHFFKMEENVKLVHDLLQYLILTKTEQAKVSDITGKVFVITGSVTKFTNRNEMKAFIEGRGGKVTGSVTSKTNYLINNDVTSSSSKNKTAKELGIPIITEEEFLELAGETQM